MACYARINIAYGLLSPLAPVFPPSQEDHLSVGKKPTKRKGVLCFECCFVLFPVARSESWFCASSGGGHGAGVVFFLPPLGWRPRTWWALWASLPRSRFLLSLPPSLLASLTWVLSASPVVVVCSGFGRSEAFSPSAVLLLGFSSSFQGAK